MRIAVTGGTGFIGRYILRDLAAHGHQLRGWYRPSSNRSGREDFPQVEWCPGTLADTAATQNLVRGCDAVIHAALDRPGRLFRGGEGDMVRFTHRNIVGTIELIEAARAAKVQRFILLSTCAVYERILDDRPLDETHPMWPNSHYGAHKAALEAFVHSYGFGHGYPICALRPTGVYGLANPPQQSKWFDLVQAVARGETVSCTHGGKEVHAADVARACRLLLEAEGIAGQSYNCYDRYVAEFEVAQLAKQFSGSAAVIRGEAMQPKHQIETQKLRDLGMEFGGAESLHQTVREMLKFVS